MGIDGVATPVVLRRLWVAGRLVQDGRFGLAGGLDALRAVVAASARGVAPPVAPTGSAPLWPAAVAWALPLEDAFSVVLRTLDRDVVLARMAVHHPSLPGVQAYRQLLGQKLPLPSELWLDGTAWFDTGLSLLPDDRSRADVAAVFAPAPGWDELTTDVRPLREIVAGTAAAPAGPAQAPEGVAAAGGAGRLNALLDLLGGTRRPGRTPVAMRGDGGGGESDVVLDCVPTTLAEFEGAYGRRRAVDDRVVGAGRVLADGDWPGLLYALDAVPEQMVVPGGLDPVVLLDWLRRTPGSGVVVRVDPLGDERPDVYFMWRRGSELVLQVPERRDREAADVPFGRDVSVSVLRSNALMAPLWWATTLVMVFDGRGVAVTVSALPGQGAAVDGPGQSGRVSDVRIDALPDSLVRRPGVTPRGMRSPGQVPQAGPASAGGADDRDARSPGDPTSAGEVGERGLETGQGASASGASGPAGPSSLLSLGQQQFLVRAGLWAVDLPGGAAGVYEGVHRSVPPAWLMSRLHGDGLPANPTDEQVHAAMYRRVAAHVWAEFDRYWVVIAAEAGGRGAEEVRVQMRAELAARGYSSVASEMVLAFVAGAFGLRGRVVTGSGRVWEVSGAAGPVVTWLRGPAVGSGEAFPDRYWLGEPARPAIGIGGPADDAPPRFAALDQVLRRERPDDADDVWRLWGQLLVRGRVEVGVVQGWVGSAPSGRFGRLRSERRSRRLLVDARLAAGVSVGLFRVGVGSDGSRWVEALGARRDQVVIGGDEFAAIREWGHRQRDPVVRWRVMRCCRRRCRPARWGQVGAFGACGAAPRAASLWRGAVGAAMGGVFGVDVGVAGGGASAGVGCAAGAVGAPYGVGAAARVGACEVGRGPSSVPGAAGVVGVGVVVVDRAGAV